MNFLRQLMINLAATWRQLTASARVVIGLAAIATVVAIVLIVYVGGRPQYVQLFPSLAPEDAAEIQTYLEDEGISYQLGDGGRTILVPVRDRSRLRVELLARDLPRLADGDGFELFDTQDLLTTNQRVQEINYQRAIQGELARMLTEFDVVRAAHVLISWPEETFILSEQKPAEAAVTLDLKRTPTAAEVKAIVNLVDAVGGPNLDANNITVATTDQGILKSPVRDEAMMLASTQQEYVQSIEDRSARKIVDAFQMAGLRAHATVSVKVNGTATRTTSKIAQDGVPLSEMTTTQTIETREELPEGPAGLTENLPSDTVVPGGVVSTDTREEELTNYLPSEVTKEETIPAGEIVGYKVAVLVENGYDTDDAGERTYRPMTEEEKTEWRELIAHAAGFDVAPEDVILKDQPFSIDGLPGTQTAVTAISAVDWQYYLVQLGKIVLVLALFFIAYRFLSRQFVVGREEEEAALEVPTATPEEMRRREIASEVERVATQQPESVASLLRTWIAEVEE